MGVGGKLHWSTCLWAGVLPAFAIILAPRIVLPPVVKGAPLTPLQIVGFSVAITLAIIWTVGFARYAFRRSDEYFQTASQFGWYWGGTIGLAVSAPIYAFIGLGGLNWLLPGVFPLKPCYSPPELGRTFQLGYMLPVLLQGFGAVIAGFWWRRLRR